MFIFYSLIQDSAPVINTIIICGCVVMLITCYLLGIDTQTPSHDGDDPSRSDEENTEMNMDINEHRDDRYSTICTVSSQLLFLSLTLMFHSNLSNVLTSY